MTANLLWRSAYGAPSAADSPQPTAAYYSRQRRSSRPGSARLSLSQKDGLPIPLLVLSISVQGHQRAQKEKAPPG
jgi:hypothetical protein